MAPILNLNKRSRAATNPRKGRRGLYPIGFAGARNGGVARPVLLAELTDVASSRSLRALPTTSATLGSADTVSPSSVA